MFMPPDQHSKGIGFTRSLVSWDLRKCRLTWTVLIIKLRDGECIFWIHEEHLSLHDKNTHFSRVCR